MIAVHEFEVEYHIETSPVEFLDISIDSQRIIVIYFWLVYEILGSIFFSLSFLGYAMSLTMKYHPPLSVKNILFL